MRGKAIASLVSMSLLLASCDREGSVAPPAVQKIVAEVGTRSISAEELVIEATRRGSGHKSVPEREELLREMIEREALLQRARQAGLEEQPAVRREIETLLIGRFLAAELDPRRQALTVTDEEVKAEYEASRPTLARPAQVRLAMLFLGTGAKASETRKGEVRARLAEARSNFISAKVANSPGMVAGFGPLSLEYSDDQVTRYRGGDLGWLEPGKRPPRVPAVVLDAGWALPVGQISELLETADGFYLVQKTDARNPAVPTFESAEPSLRQAVLVRKRKALDEQFRAETARVVRSVVHTQALASVTLPAPPAVVADRNREPQPPGLPGSNESSHGN